MRAVKKDNPVKPKLTIVGAILWIGVGLAVTFLDTDVSRQTVVLSWMQIIFGVWVFLRHGGPYVTAAGVWSICSALFVGYGGLHWHDIAPHDEAMANAVGAAFLTHMFMYYLFWQGAKLRPPVKLGTVSPEALRGMFGVGALLLAAGTALSLVGVAGTLSSPAAFTGVILATVALVMGGVKRIRVLPLLLVGAMAAVYVQFVFVGFGRLVLAALAFSIIMVLAAKYRTYWIKLLSLIAIPPALVLLIEQREEFGVELYGAALDGIGSVVAPIRQFAVMLANPAAYELAWSSTFWGALVTHVPRSLWEGKPEGFPLEVAWIYNPTLASIGGTLATLLHGEFIYNFGPLGLVVMVVAAGLLVRWVDAGVLRRITSGLASRRDAIVLAALVIVAGGMTDLLWSDAHTFMGRTGTRLLILLALYLAWGWMQSSREKREYRLARRYRHIKNRPVPGTKPVGATRR